MQKSKPTDSYRDCSKAIFGARKLCTGGNVVALADWTIWSTFAAWFTPPMLKELLTGAIGALLGAWGGAHAIRRINERKDRRDALRNEVLRTNAAIAQVYILVGTFLI
jgi:hypothetical protein